MVAPWTRWRVRRRLGDALAPDEDIELIEPLALRGWWVLTDRTLFTVDDSRAKAVPLSQIRSVETKSGAHEFVTIVTVASHIVIGDLPRRSRIAARLAERSGPSPA